MVFPGGIGVCGWYKIRGTEEIPALIVTELWEDSFSDTSECCMVWRRNWCYVFVVICMVGFLSLYVDVCFKTLPADICVCRKQLSLEWKTVSLSAVLDVGVILLSPVPNLLAAVWLDGGQWRCKQCSVPCSLLCGHPCGQEEQETAGCWCGSARYFCECLSSFSPVLLSHSAGLFVLLQEGHKIS